MNGGRKRAAGGGRRGAAAGAVREMHLAVQLPRCPEHPLPPLDFDAYVRLARAAERGLFDFLLLAGDAPPWGDTAGEAGGGPGRAAGEAPGRPGRTAGEAPGGPGRTPRQAVRGPEPFTVLNALAAVTDRIGLVAAVPGAARAPYELARRVAALDRLSAGRAAVIEDDGGAKVVVTGGGRARPGGKILARIRFSVTETETEGDARRAVPPSSSGVVTGVPGTVAARLAARVWSGEVDGYVLLPEPALAGRGLDAFVDRVVPLLQERGALRTDYRGTTPRDRPEPPGLLGRPAPGPASRGECAVLSD